MVPFPEHLEGLVGPKIHVISQDAGVNFDCIEIICHCGSARFSLLVSNRKSLMAVCSACMRQLIIYDLALYTSSSKLPGFESYDQCLIPPTNPAQILVAHEYGETDPGDRFDRNDVSWCYVFAKQSGAVRRVFEDETA